MSSYIGAIQEFIARIGPWFLHNKNIGTFLESVAVTLDSSVLSLEQGLKLSQPLRCDVSALPVLSKDRSLRIYATEPTVSQRLRLARWLQLHRQRGTHQGEMRHSQPYFLPDTPMMRIVHQAGDGSSATWHTLAADGTYSVHRSTPSNWNYDGATSKWSRFWVVTYAPAAILSATHWDDGHHWDDGSVWGGVLATIAQDLVAMILEWKAAHSRLGAYILATDPASFDPTATAATLGDGSTTLPVGNWGSAFSGPPTVHPTRLGSAIWIYEDGT